MRDWIASPPSRGRLAMTGTCHSSLRGTKQSSLLINVLPIHINGRHEAIQSLNQRVTDLRHWQARSNFVFTF